MNPSCLVACTLAAKLALCAACKRASPSVQSQNATAVGGAHPQTAMGTPVAGVIISTSPGGAVIGQAGAPGNRPEQNAGQPFVNTPASEAPARPLADTEERLGPFTLAQGQDFLVIVHSKRLEEQPGKFNQAAAWLEIRDATGVVQYHEDYAYTVERGAFNEQCSRQCGVPWRGSSPDQRRGCPETSPGLHVPA